MQGLTDKPSVLSYKRAASGYRSAFGLPDNWARPARITVDIGTGEMRVNPETNKSRGAPAGSGRSQREAWMRGVLHRVRVWMEPVREHVRYRLALLPSIKGVPASWLVGFAHNGVSRFRGQRGDGLLARTLRIQSLWTLLVYFVAVVTMSLSADYFVKHNPVLGHARALRSLHGVVFVGAVILAVLLFFANLFGRRLLRNALKPLSRLEEPLVRIGIADAGSPVKGIGDKEIAAVGRALEYTIAAVKERDEQLRRVTERDPLTGLATRTSIMRAVQSALEDLRHDHGASALLFVDLDQFKYVNETVGHDAGDRLLVQVAESLCRRIREHDVVARFGGDEFLILARDVDQSGAIGIARAILALLQGMSFSDGGHTFNVRGSIGITMVSSNRHSAEELVAQADMACFEAKNRGRNRYNLFEIGDLEHQNLLADVGWSQRIRDAIDFDRFRLHYQPMVSVDADDCELYEVLLRLPDENGALVSPLVFLPAAERFGMMVEIDYWVIEHALRALRDQRANGRDVCLSINLSGHVFEDQALASRIVQALESNHIDGSRVIFEVTEQAAVRYMDTAASLIRSLRNHGCRFALDDFGTGFSSYGYIKNLPIDFIKIGGAFVEEMKTDRIDEVMVRSIVEVARALGKKTIAESVGDRDTLELLRAMGVDYFQGRYCGKPVAKLPNRRVLAVANQG